jgi:hypothetical protein
MSPAALLQSLYLGLFALNVDCGQLALAASQSCYNLVILLNCHPKMQQNHWQIQDEKPYQRADGSFSSAGQAN